LRLRRSCGFHDDIVNTNEDHIAQSHPLDRQDDDAHAYTHSASLYLRSELSGRN
jgi:hypothetical protein